ncbi:hypothetical protein JTE90_014514 [Oedothorax gibbosus]|uniref:Peptidase S1 domain-containing protein n=1 Tax=Oedothorax gibbosus TaxID=931172 RepID=A0AAV6VJ12_9ARAC|nr:hypothetical protein JTE90_014514 [Oedothorax gibbosus]
MKLSRKYQTLWILFWVSISISASLADEEDAADNMSRSRFHRPSSEMTCIFRGQQGVCKRRSECRRPTRHTCRFGLDPVVCCLDRQEEVTVRRTTTNKPVRMTTKKIENVKNGIDITFPGCGKRSPNVPERATTTRRGGLFSRIGKRDVGSRFQRTRFRRFDRFSKPVIVGGVESKANSWPWMVAIFKTSVSGGPKRFLCGASLISRRYVLTAAHCFDAENGKIDPSKFSIIVGAHKTSDGTEYPVSNVLIHPEYQRRQYYNDITILKIGKDVQLTKKVYPVCLPSDGLRDKIRVDVNNVTVTGWGDTSFGGVSSKVLQEVNMPIVPLKSCNASYASVAKVNFPRGINNLFICAGLKEGGKDACQGDSGGPMVNKLKDHSYVQLGVVSFGYGCAQAGYPGVYTRLSKYTQWLYDNTDLGR